MTNDLTYLGKKVDPSTLAQGEIILDAIPVANEVAQIIFRCDEITAKCPITGQPDFYTAEIILHGPFNTIESKSLKLYLQSFSKSDQGIFAEDLAAKIARDVYEVIGEDVEVVLTQKARGGITIETVAVVTKMSKAMGALSSFATDLMRELVESDHEEEDE